MNGTDFFVVLGYLIGGAGIAGLVTSYFQLREQRKEQARSHLRETALTPAFRKALGTMFMVVPLAEELGAAPKDGKESSLLKETLQSIMDLHWDDAMNPDVYSSLLFLPKNLQLEFLGLMSSIRQLVHTSYESLLQQKTVASDLADLAAKFERLSIDLRKVLGID
jgi:hypothetical protein